MPRNEGTGGSAAPRDARALWYGVLTAFPFLYLPTVALAGILCAIIMPILTGASK
jgi:hypothetical protein